MKCLWVTALNSGSNGNCYYVGNEEEAVLIDAGLSCRETEKRMRRLDLSMTKVKAIFISHEHGDHIKGVEVISKKYRLPVYITAGTLKHSRLRLDPQLTFPFFPEAPVAIGSLSVKAFPKFHDAADPHSFTVEGHEVCIGIFTDIGKVCSALVTHFERCHAAFLETNYDEIMLQNGRYPHHLKNRIRGGLGHLSNREAFELFSRSRPDHLSHLFLSHLSADNNTPELALELFHSQPTPTRVIVASRYAEMPVHCISSGTMPHASVPVHGQKQLTLF